MKRKLLSLTLTLGLLLSLCSAVCAAEYPPTQHFPDVPTTHWAFSCIEELVQRNAITGYPDGNFYPGKTVTREEFAKIMVVAAGLTPSPADKSSYADVPLSRWSSPYIETARPYMTAYRNGDQLFFYPLSGALREDMAVAVVKLRGYDPAQADLSLIYTMFSDYTSISEVTRPYVALAVEHGIIHGYDDGTFRGQGTITRAEAASILYRAFQQTSGDKVIPDDLPPTPTPIPTPEVTQEPSPEVTPPPMPEPSQTPTQEPTPSTPPEPIAPTTRYGYITSDSYFVYSPKYKDTYVAFTLWTGTETIDVLTQTSGSYSAGTAVTYTDMGNGIIGDVSSLTDVTAVIAYSVSDNLLMISSSGNKFDFSETVIIYIDSSAGEGVANGSLWLAEMVDDPFDRESGYYPNAIAHLSEDGKTLKALFIDVDNQIAGASPVFRD